MEFFREFLKNRRNVAALGVLLFFALSLPIALFLLKQEQTFFSNASGQLITLVDGNCIQTISGNKVATCTNVSLRLTNPFSLATSLPSTTASATVAPSNPSNSSNPSSTPAPSSSASVTPGGVVNVHSFNDDISAAVSSLGDNGGSVYVPAGNYNLTSNISLPSNTTLFGDGASTVIHINAADNGITNKNHNSQHDTNIVIRDLTVIGDGSSTGGCCYGIRLRDISNAFVANVTVQNFSLDGITLYYKHVSGQTRGADHVRVSGCNVSGNGRQQISIIHGQNNVIDNCTTSGPSGNVYSGIDLEPDAGGDTNADNNIIVGNNVSGSNVGITLLGVGGESQDPNVVQGNAVCNNSVSTPSVAYANGGKNNIFVGNSGGGVDTRSGANTLNGPSSACDIPSSMAIPPAPAKPQAMRPVQNQLSQNYSWISSLASKLTSAASMIQTWFTPKTAFALGGFSSVTTNGCGEIISTPAQDATEGDFVYKSPIRANNEWETAKQDGTILTQQQIQDKVQSDFRNGTDTFFDSTYINCNVYISYSQNGDCAVDAPPKGREGVNGGKLSPGETVTFHVRSDNTAQSPGCRIQMQTELAGVNPSASPIASATVAPSNSSNPSLSPSSTATATSSAIPAPTANSYRLAESQDKLASTPWVILTGDTVVTNFTVSSDPGPKQVWVEFINTQGQSVIDHTNTFNLLAPAPTVAGVDCTLDLTSKNLKVVMNGANFGSQNGTFNANGSAMQIVSWTNSAVTGILTTSTGITTGQKFTINLTRPDQVIAPTQTCQVDTSTISLGARTFCRVPGKFDVANVEVTIAPASDPANSVKETVAIDKDGVVQGLKTKLQSGSQYIISIKAPGSIRRNTTFTAQTGTTVVNAPDGKPFILPVGDIAPVGNLDGAINSNDRAELVKEWQTISTPSAALAGDFNRDTRVNSIDWACMRYDFNAKDDQVGSTGSSYTTGLQVVTGQNSAIFTSQ